MWNPPHPRRFDIERALCPVLVGRQDELAFLEDALRGAISGQGRLVVLGGEPGSGKSRLSAEVVGLAESLGAAVLSGACPETDLALPYLPFVEAIGAHLVGADKAWVRSLGDARHELAKLFPQMGEKGRAELDDPVRAKLRMFEAIGAVLDATAAAGGLLLVLEDVHWADTSSRELLEYLAGRLPLSRVMILATYRSDEMDRRHPLYAQLQAWKRNGRAEAIQVKPLSPALVGEMVMAIFGAADIPVRLRDAVYRRSEGNPFVLEELLKEALDEGTLAYEKGLWSSPNIDSVAPPRTVADGILRRLDRVGPGPAAVLRAASVLGQSFGYGLLKQVAAVSEEHLQDAVEVGIRQQLLEDEEHSTGQRYRFRHALTRDAIYHEMVEPQRRNLHRLAAEALGRQPGTAPVEIAVHLLAAGSGADAVPICLAAADDAIRRRGYREAADLYNRVLPYINDDVEQGRVLCQLGEALWQSGDPATAQSNLEKGTATLERVGRETDAAHYLMTLARCHWERSRLDLAHAGYERARELLAPLGPSEDLAVAYSGLAGLYAFELDGPNAQHLAELAVAVAGEVGAAAPLIRAYSFLGIALVFQGQVDRGIEFMDRSHREALAKDLDWNALTALYNSIIIRLWHLRAAECPALVEQLREFPAGWWRDLAYWRARALTHQMLGRLDTALEASEQVRRLADEGGASTFSQWARRQRAYLLAEMGRAQEALEELPARQDGEDRQELFFDYQARMRVHLCLAQPKLASELAALVLAAGDWAQDALVVGAAAEAFVAAGQGDRARHLLALAVTDGIDPTSPYLLAAAGRVDLANGDVEAALPRLVDASRLFGARGYRVDCVRTRLLTVRALAARGEKRAAQSELDSCLVEADDCGAVALRREARGLGRDFGLRVGRAMRPAEPTTSLQAEPGGPAQSGLVGELRLALRQDELRLHYQPKLNLVTGRIDAVEGLVRWQHPRLGLIFPDRFIPIAEKSGLVGGLTQWVLAAGLAQARAWRDRGLLIKVSLNVAASDLGDPRFADVVEAALESAAVDADLLCLEVTESQVMNRPDRARATLDALRALGVALSIDDFGTGHSSLAYVRELPVSELKIDRSFCMVLDDRTMGVVRAAIDMGHNLGMTVTAEGVESRATLTALAGFGCDSAQGLVIGGAVEAAAVTRRLRREARKFGTVGVATARPPN